MKTPSRLLCWIFLSFPLTVLVAAVAQPANTALPEATVTERGEQYRVWQRTIKTMLDDGRVVDQAGSYVELGNGICYFDGQQWLDSQEIVEVFPDGAVARKGPHQDIFSGNINTSAAVDLLTSDGKRFKS